jgi:hypothetical protein
VNVNRDLRIGQSVSAPAVRRAAPSEEPIMNSLRAWGRAATCALASALVFSAFTAPAEAVDRTRRAGRVVRPAAPARLTASERRAVTMERFFRGDGIRRCWMRQLLRDPTTTTRRLPVVLRVDSEGRIRDVRVRDPMAPTLAACIAATSATLAPVGPGEVFEAEGTLTLERGQ